VTANKRVWMDTVTLVMWVDVQLRWWREEKKPEKMLLVMDIPISFLLDQGRPNPPICPLPSWRVSQPPD
jgi:hypothetical protein